MIPVATTELRELAERVCCQLTSREHRDEAQREELDDFLFGLPAEVNEIVCRRVARALPSDSEVETAFAETGSMELLELQITLTNFLATHDPRPTALWRQLQRQREARRMNARATGRIPPLVDRWRCTRRRIRQGEGLHALDEDTPQLLAADDLVARAVDEWKLPVSLSPPPTSPLLVDNLTCAPGAPSASTT